MGFVCPDLIKSTKTPAHPSLAADDRRPCLCQTNLSIFLIENELDC